MGLIDDNPNKRGMDVHGVRVLGTTQDLTSLSLEFQIDLIIIAIPSAGSSLMRRIVNLCELSNIPCRTLPSISALAAGKVEVNGDFVM